MNPNNPQERKLIEYASGLCANFTESECETLIEKIDNEQFGGPMAIGERVFDLLSCCDASWDVMLKVAGDSTLPMERRINALYMSFGCENCELSEHSDLVNDPKLCDVYRALCDEESD